MSREIVNTPATLRHDPSWAFTLWAFVAGMFAVPALEPLLIPGLREPWLHAAMLTLVTAGRLIAISAGPLLIAAGVDWWVSRHSQPRPSLRWASQAVIVLAVAWGFFYLFRPF